MKITTVYIRWISDDAEKCYCCASNALESIKALKNRIK